MSDAGAAPPRPLNGSASTDGFHFPEHAMSNNDAILVVDPKGLINFASSQTEAIFGHRPDDLIGKSLSLLLPQQAAPLCHPNQQPNDEASKSHALRKDGSEFVARSELFPVITPEGCFVVASIREDASADPVRIALENENARLRALVKQAGLNASQSVVAKRFQRLLLEESHHRMKNSLAMVIAITSQSLRNSETIEQARTSIEGRLRALAKAQDLLLHTNVAGAKLATTISAAIEPFETPDDPRFVVQAVSIQLGPGAVLPLTLSFNELCTNAAKYGALSTNTGRVKIASRIDDKAQRLKLSWSESGGPPVSEPKHQSFGTRLIRRLAEQLHGDVWLNFHPSGFVFELEASVPVLQTLRVQ